MGLRGPKPQGEAPWMRAVAELMIKEHMSFTSACMAMGVKFETGQEELVVQYSDEFQNLLDAISYKFYARIGDNPLLTKGVLAGVLMTAVRRLGEQGDWSAVHMPGKLLADLMGWTDEHTDKPVLANLSQREIDELKVKVAEAQKAQDEAQNVAQPVKVIIVDGNPN